MKKSRQAPCPFVLPGPPPQQRCFPGSAYLPRAAVPVLLHPGQPLLSVRDLAVRLSFLFPPRTRVASLFDIIMDHTNAHEPLLPFNTTSGFPWSQCLSRCVSEFLGSPVSQVEAAPSLTRRLRTQPRAPCVSQDLLCCPGSPWLLVQHTASSFLACSLAELLPSCRLAQGRRRQISECAESLLRGGCTPALSSLAASGFERVLISVSAFPP